MKNWKRVLQTASVAGLAGFMLSGCGEILKIIAQREVVARMNSWFGPLLQNYQQ